MKDLELVPGNWLYNAGVIGFLRVMEVVGEPVETWLREDGSVAAPRREIPPESMTLKWFSGYYDLYFDEVLRDQTREQWEKRVQSCVDSGNSVDFCKTSVLWGTLFNALARGLFNADSRRIRENLPAFARYVGWALMSREKDTVPACCSFCGRPLLVSEYREGKVFLTSEHIKLLGGSPSDRGFPNSFWNARPDLIICSTCSWMILTYPLAVHRLEGAQVFLNAPSFKLMWYLNRVGREIFSRGGSRSIRELFGTTLMEMSLRHQLALGIWTAMNVEVVHIRADGVDFLSLPADRVMLLTHPTIASLLKSLGDTKYLQWVMEGQENRLTEEAQKTLREAMVKQKKPKENHPKAMKLLKLYTHIQEVQKHRGGVYA